MEPTNTDDSRTAQAERAAYKSLEEYGIIGNRETVALVGRDGSIDWCCFPDVDSSSLFASILDSRRGGRFAVSPVRSFEARQEYVDATNVLRTRFRTDGGRATVTDFMPVPESVEGESGTHRAVYRKVTCERGQIELAVRFEPRFEYAQTAPAVERTRYGVAATGNGETATLTSSIPLAVADDAARASFTLAEGETRWLVLGYEHEVPDRPADHRRLLDDVVDYWRDWAHERSNGDDDPIDGEWHRLAVRSALILKLLIHRDTGAICAAPTTSLPEDVGGVRNWDYRYNWIRDSTFTVQALAELGHFEEAEEYFDLCLAHCARAEPADVQPVYGLDGENDLAERTLDHLAGYRNSRPVRVGNDAYKQRQLDVYGELIAGVREMLRYGGTISERDWTVMRNIIDYVCETWRQPDVGIWELRNEPRQFVYSKVMCWAALDRGLDIVDATDFDAPVERWREVRREIKETVLERGYSDDIDSFVSSFEGDDELDAATLLIPTVGFLPADDPRVQGTIDSILDRLTTADGLVDRYEIDDGVAGEEGAFVVCSFWLVNALALSGRTDEAATIFRSVCEYVSPLGLLAEEIDTESGEQAGNVPQAFSQIGLITSALYLDDADVDLGTGETPIPDVTAEEGTTTYPGLGAGDRP